MGFSRPEYLSGQPFASPGGLPNPGIEPRVPHCRQILYQLSHKGSAFNPLILAIALTPAASVCPISSFLYYAALCLVSQSCLVFVIPWTAAHQSPLSMGILQARVWEYFALCFSRGIPDPGTEPTSPAWAGWFFTVSHQRTPDLLLWPWFLNCLLN